MSEKWNAIPSSMDPDRILHVEDANGRAIRLSGFAISASEEGCRNTRDVLKARELHPVLLSALKAMDAALTQAWPAGPDDKAVRERIGDFAADPWKMVRSAIAQADGQNGSALRAEREGRITREEALAYFTPHVLTKGPVMLDPEKMRAAVAALGQAEAPDSYIVGLEVTEQICFDKLKKERDAYREALGPFAKEADRIAREWPSMTSPGAQWAIKFAHLDRARTLLSQSSEGGELK